MFRELVDTPPAASELRAEQRSSLRELAPGEWAAMARNLGLFASEPFLLAVERSATAPTTYILLRDAEGRLRAGLPCYLWEGAPDPGLDHYEPFRMGGRWILSKRAREQLWRPTLLVGSRSGYRTSFVLDPSWVGGAEQLVTRLAQEVAALADRTGAQSVGWMWLTPESAAQLAGCLRFPEDLLLAGPNCSIPLPPPSFEGYLGRLSCSRRKSARREMQRFASSGLVVEHRRLSECADELAPLAVNLQRRYGHQPDQSTLSAELQVQAELLDDQSIVLLCRDQGRAVGFSLLYRWEEVLYGRMAGFDYQAVGRSDAYFNLAFYDPVRLGYELEMRRYHLGMAAWKAKVMRGATLEPAWILVWPPPRVRGPWRRVISQRTAPGAMAAWWAREFPAQVDLTGDWRWTLGGLLSPTDRRGTPVS